MRKTEVDPLSYIEGAFLDVAKEQPSDREEEGFEAPPFVRGRAATRAPLESPRTSKGARQQKNSGRGLVQAVRDAKAPREPMPKAKLKATKMNAPRPRKRRSPPPRNVIAPEIERIWQDLPKNLKFLASVYDDKVTRKYYASAFKESREELIRRLMDPELSLEDTARLLGVCPATVRRYTNRGWLRHHRTPGRQRRFRLSGIVSFLEEYGRNPE